MLLPVVDIAPGECRHDSLIHLGMTRFEFTSSKRYALNEVYARLISPRRLEILIQ